MILIAFGVQTIIGTPHIVGVGNAICRHTAVMVCLGINHFATLPNGSVTEVYNGSACIMAGVTVIAKQTRAGYFICIYPVYSIVAGNIDDILKIPHIAVIDVQHLFPRPTIDCTTVEIYYDVILSCTKVGIYIDNLTACVESAAIKCHYRRTVCPNGITAKGRIKDGIFERGALITPKGSPPLNNTILNDRNISVRKSQIVLIVRNAEFHFFKSDALTALETIVTVILAALTRIHFRADTPKSFFGALTDESKSLFLHQLFPSILFFF